VSVREKTGWIDRGGLLLILGVDKLSDYKV
jgi:hypothetical protein